MNNNMNNQFSKFSANLIDAWKRPAETLLVSMINNNIALDDILVRAKEELYMFQMESFNSSALSFKIINLLLFNSHIGYVFTIDSIKDIYGRKIITKRKLLESLLHLKEKKQKSYNSNITKQKMYNSNKNIENTLLEKAVLCNKRSKSIEIISRRNFSNILNNLDMLTYNIEDESSNEYLFKHQTEFFKKSKLKI